MLLSSIGDWAGIVAVTVLVARLGGAQGGAFAVAGVMVARLVPLLVFGPVAGVLIDRFDRRTLMVIADLGRAFLYGVLPFVGHLGGIFAISFFIEALALLWGPSLDAALPKVVGPDELAKANSINLLTSYGTLPLGAALFTVLAAFTRTSGGPFGTSAEALPLWFDAATFAVSAVIVSRLDLGGRPRAGSESRRRPIRTDLAAEWRFLHDQPRVRALILSLVVGFVGAGALTALGPLFAVYTLGVGNAGYGLLISTLGIGLAGGMISLIRPSDAPAHGFDRRLTWAMVVLGAGLIVLAGAVWLLGAGLVTLGLGAAGGVAWVSGYTLLQQQVTDEYRGRTFVLLSVVGRIALLSSRVVFPLLAGLAGSVAGPRIALVAAGLLVLSGAWVSRPDPATSP